MAVFPFPVEGSILRVYYLVLWMEDFAFHLPFAVGGSCNLRSQGLPVLTWIDDFYFTNFRITRSLTSSAQFRAAQSSWLPGDERVLQGRLLYVYSEVLGRRT